MRDIFTLSLIASTIRLATPLVLAALGGLFSERSGVINIALEGKMLAGAFTAAAVTYAADTRLGMGAASPWIGLLGGMIAGLFIAVIYAVIANVSIGRLFLGGIGPGVMIGIALLIAAHYYAVKLGHPKEPRARLKETLAAAR